MNNELRSEVEALRRQQSIITVIWETVPDADSEAVDKAFDMLLRRNNRSGTLVEMRKTRPV